MPEDVLEDYKRLDALLEELDPEKEKISPFVFIKTLNSLLSKDSLTGEEKGVFMTCIHNLIHEFEPRWNGFWLNEPSSIKRDSQNYGMRKVLTVTFHNKCAGALIHEDPRGLFQKIKKQPYKTNDVKKGIIFCLHEDGEPQFATLNYFGIGEKVDLGEYCGSKPSLCPIAKCGKQIYRVNVKDLLSYISERMKERINVDLADPKVQELIDLTYKLSIEPQMKQFEGKLEQKGQNYIS